MADQIISSGIDAWGNASCDATAPGQHCTMHPCTTTLEITLDGVTHVASRTDDASGDGTAFAAAVFAVERAARVWQWVDGAVDPSDQACTTSTECTFTADRCGGLHATTIGTRANVADPADCKRALAPRDAVEPVCQASRCAVAPADTESRHCNRAHDCSPVWMCDGFGALRKDPNVIRNVTIRNEHPRCFTATMPVPAVGCLRGVCVVR